MIVAVVLAAGDSTRYGSPKQLALLDGRPMLAHVIDTARAAPEVDQVLVVLGAHADTIATELDLSQVEVVIAADWATGMAASLTAGVSAAANSCADGALILLGDQPMVEARSIAKVVAEADSRRPAARATFSGKPGHPVLIRQSLFAAVTQLEGDDGARDLLETSGCTPIECGPSSIVDIDTPADLQRLGEVVGRSV